MAYIKAISYYLPPDVVTNEMLQAEFPDEDVAKIAKGVGVERRHVSRAEEASSDLAFEAGHKLLQDWKIDPEEVDFLLLCTQTPDRFSPSTSCLAHQKLGLRRDSGACGMDLGCSGYVYGLSMAKAMVDSGMAKNVLLLTADVVVRLIHPEDKNRMLFGEAASATLVGDSGIAQIGDAVYGTDGSGADYLTIKNGAFAHKELTGSCEIDNEGNPRRDDCFYMDGEAVFDFTVTTVPGLVKETLEKNHLQPEQIARYVLHQPNKFLLGLLRKYCGVDKARWHVDLTETGNTTSSTVPIGLVQSLEQGLIKKGDNVVIAGFGVGLSWAGNVLKF